MVMNRHLVLSEPFVPRGRIGNANPPIIRFSTDGRGLPLIAAKNMVAQVADGDLPAMQGSGVANSSITFRTMWPGYKHDFTARAINGASLDRTQLAAEVAKHIANFFTSVRKGNIASTDPSYAIIERRMSLQDIYLEGIVNTTGTCWQAIIYLSCTEHTW